MPYLNCIQKSNKVMGWLVYLEDWMLSTLLTTLLVIDCFVMILLIIALQQGNEGGIGSAFGSENSSGFFGASGGVTFIVRATWVAGVLFFVLSTSLAWVKTRQHFGVGKELESLVTGPDSAAPVAADTATQTATSSTVVTSTGTETSPTAPTPAAQATP